MAFDNDELKLIAAALRERGWIGPNQTIPHGDVTKYKGEDHMLAGLRAILEALVEAKVQEEGPQLQTIYPEIAGKMFMGALQKIGVDANITIHHHTKDLHEIGPKITQKLVIKPPSFGLTIEDISVAQMADFINLIRANPSDLGD